MLHRTLRLALEVDQLASSNKALREVWSERQPGIYKLVKKLLVAPIGTIVFLMESIRLADLDWKL